MDALIRRLWELAGEIGARAASDGRFAPIYDACSIALDRAESAGLVPADVEHAIAMLTREEAEAAGRAAIDQMVAVPGNRAMREKLAGGKTIDVRDAKRLGPYYVLGEFVDGHDYCDSSADENVGRWIFSIGRTERAITFTREGVTHVARAGTILASQAADLYEVNGITCLFLR